MWTRVVDLDGCAVSHSGGLKRLVIQLHTEVSDANNNGKYLTVDFDIEVSFIFLLIITVHVIDIVMPVCSAPL